MDARIYVAAKIDSGYTFKFIYLGASPTELHVQGWASMLNVELYFSVFGLVDFMLKEFFN